MGQNPGRTGVSPATHSAKNVTAKALQESLSQIKTVNDYRDRAQDLKKRIQKENGVIQTANALESIIEKRK